MAAATQTARAATSVATDRPDRGRPVAAVSPPSPLGSHWPRALLALAAALTLAGSFAVIGAPLWLSVCVGALAGLRVAALGSGAGPTR